MADKFDKSKTERLATADLSRKGSIDSAIIDLVKYINSLSNYFTTSSCSGRIIIVENDVSAKAPKKKGCKWHFTSHEQTSVEAVMDSLQVVEGDLVLKFEPFIMHVQCRWIRDAQSMHSAAVSSGFRNSGISVNTKGKVIMAVRSSHGLEVPLSHDGQLLVSEQYIAFLVGVANSKMEENFNRIARFFEAVRKLQSDSQNFQDDVKPQMKTAPNGKEKAVCSKPRETKEKTSINETVSVEDTFGGCLSLFDPEFG